MNGPQVLGLVGGMGILALMFELLRRQRLRERHALIWSVLALGAVLVGFVPQILVTATRLLHLQVPTNLLFFIATIVLLGLTLQHSIELSRAEERLRALAEETALLRLQLEERQGEADAQPLDPHQRTHDAA